VDKLIIEGGKELSGSVKISKAKNAYLPILCGVLLSDKPITLRELPNLSDIRTIKKILQNLGVKIEETGQGTLFNAAEVTSHEVTYDLVKTMRASITVMGSLLSRFGKAVVSLPGGCAIGTRPIDIHLANFERMGAEIEVKGGYVYAHAKKLKGARLPLRFPSVGATENLMMAAVLAEGKTTIENAAREPEVIDLANFLIAMGAKIEGAGTSHIEIEGVKELKPVDYTAIGDRIEASTYIMAALATNSQVDVLGFDPSHLDFVIVTLEAMGAKFETLENGLRVHKSTLKEVKVETAPYPRFPTDVQAQMMALMTQIEGTSILTENVFENRFMHVPELKRLGADISLEGKAAIVKGKTPLTGAPVMCTDLRASASLVIGALAANGASEILRVYHLDRGYEKLEEKLSGLGASVRRES
jgi:UDP-N-acetylglucosamine 1-carboxyvinyltransferase